MNTSDYVNLGAGAYSVVDGLLNKKPKLQAYRPVRLNIRPAQGDEEALRRSRNEVAQQASAANRDVTRMAGADVTAGLQARLGVQANANQALIQAEAQNAQLLRQDQNRMSQELNQQESINSQLANEQIGQQNAINEQRYQARADRSRQGINSALNYQVQKDANMQNNAILERQANERVNAIRGSIYQDAYTQAITRHGDSDKARIEAEQAMAGFDAKRGMYP